MEDKNGTKDLQKQESLEQYGEIRLIRELPLVWHELAMMKVKVSPEKIELIFFLYHVYHGTLE